MLVYQNEEFANIYKDLELDPKWGERDFVSYARDYMNRNNHKILAIGGLRGTGKTVGLLQAIKDFDACYIVAQREEDVTGEDYISFLKDCDKRYIVIDEYSWIKDREPLDQYLYTAVQNGKRIAITGTESITLDFLNYRELLHRVDMVHCTLFSYDEYCRLNNLTPCKASCMSYLKNGGTFKEYAVKNFDTMQNYIKTAIVDNLAAYTKLPIEDAAALVYSVLYKAVCPSNLDHVPVLSENKVTVKNFLDLFGIDSDKEFSETEVKRVGDILEQIGVVVKIPNWERTTTKTDSKYYIVNPSLTCQLILAAYDIPDVNSSILGLVYEASVVSHLWYNRSGDDKLYFLDIQGESGVNKELDIIATQDNGRFVYLFECKLRSESKLSSNATLLSEMIDDCFPDGEILGRYVVYNGEETVKVYDGKEVVFSPLNRTIETYYDFERHVERIKGLAGTGGRCSSGKSVDYDSEE
jgi:predicted AAA+ superfamily ATPase